MKLSPVQIEEHALHFVLAHYATEGSVPTQRELLRALGYGQSSHHVADRLFKSLAARGFLRRSRFHRGYQVVQTKYQYPADCSCGVCTNVRNFAQLQLIEGLHVEPPAALVPKLRNLRPLSGRTRVYWLDGFPATPTGSAA